MNRTKLDRELGAIQLSQDFEELLRQPGHVELSSCGEIGAGSNEQYGVVGPCIAEVFSLVVAPVRSPASTVADFASFAALAKAVEKLGLLRSKKVWWVDPVLRCEVSSIASLKTILHQRHNFPAAIKEFQKYWESISLSWDGQLPAPLQVPSILKTKDRQVRSTARKAEGHRLGMRFGATFVDSSFEASLESATRIELSPRCKLRDCIGCEHLGLSDVEEAEVFCLTVAHPDQPDVIVADFPTYDMIKAACTELGILDGSRPVWWIDLEDRTPISDFPALDRLLEQHRSRVAEVYV